MRATSRTPPAHLSAGVLGCVLRAFWPPVRTVQFWIAQAGVVSLAMFHDVVLADIPYRGHPFSVADAMSSALLLIPVIYAAVSFGFRGSVATAMWATALIVPHWFLMHPLSENHLMIELGNLAILNVVAIVVGQRVESEQRARHRAETALHAASAASARYQGLFEQQPAPVIIADGSGTISEVNTAATRLFSSVIAGSPLEDVLSVTAGQLLGAQPPRLSLRTAEGGQRVFVPTAHALDIEGTRLLQIVLTDVTEEQRRQEEQRAYSGRLLAVQEEERRRLAQELHDDPLQNLVYLTRVLDELTEDASLPARLLPTLRQGGELASVAATALREVIHGLRPPVLDDIGLIPALRQLATDVRKRSSLVVSLRCTGTEGGMSPDLKLAAYRIIQESLNNVMLHAQALHATVRVRFGDPLTLKISDDGRGIRPGPRMEDCLRPGMGLIGMRERAALLGGTLHVGARSPHGTVIQAALPADGKPTGREYADTCASCGSGGAPAQRHRGPTRIPHYC